MTLGTSAYKVQQTDIAFQNLPRAFDDFKIVQISDLHLGSLSPQSGNIAKLVGEINALQPDVILFTGDMINSFAAELLPWIAELRKLHAPYGKFAVRGNHDYGDYHRWKTPEERDRNLANFKQNMQDAGFTLLDNANVPLVRGNDTIYIAGEENWGKPPFQQYGNLEEAIAGTENHFLILMSHDPSHWRAEILAHDIPLTLSGHTHAMQIGIIIGSYKWSPARYMYPEYEGLYERDGKYIFVSSGAGFLGIGGRIGFRPHIEDIHLKSSLR
ncbi:hypothetical protein FACS1894195_0720 [Bacteroidia bacterium]|nr:hypothetical protein FACS1894195_0720 [Bacteroidia bacterium]